MTVSIKIQDQAKYVSGEGMRHQADVQSTSINIQAYFLNLNLM